ncbi:UDP-glucuronosyltransferase 2B16 [Armadillidium vulgare]|nr:UDP-glucuronosyltransferase 2B16 [Armadillidium vulgare]
MANNVDFPSVFASKVLGASFPLSFKERLLNTFYNGFFGGVFKFYLIPSFKTLEVPPRPVIPNIIYAGGAHIKPAKAVPKKILVKVFWIFEAESSLEWSEESMPDLPQNVMLRKWLPQRDLLGHPKIRLFITHGGVLSTQESNYHGVPVIGMPVFGDQHSNMMEAEKEGWARVMNWKELEENTFRKLILDTINDHNYVKQLE